MKNAFHRSMKIGPQGAFRIGSALIAMIASSFAPQLLPATVPAVTRTATASSVGSLDSVDRVGLVRSWETTLPITQGIAEGSEIKFVIPASSHPAFYLDEMQLDKLLNDPEVSEAERQRFLGNLDVWVILNTPTTREVVSSRDRGLNGKVLGIEGAMRLTEIRKELLAKQGLEVTQEIRFIPNAMVFAMNEGGSLQAMDAETGKVLWTRRLNKGRAPIQGFAVSDHTVAVVNGSHIELYNANTGTLLKQHSIEVLPWGPPAIAGNDILVTGINGRIELMIPFGERSYRHAQGGFSGRIHMPLTALNRSYVWGDEKGVYISERSAPARPLFRIPTTEPQTVPPAGVGNLLVIPLADGEVKCFTQTSGLSAWTTFIGHEVVQQPTIVMLPAAEGAAAPDAGAAEEPAAGDASDDPFGQPADDSAGEDPFGAPAAGGAAQPAEDPFATPSSGGAQDDPFGAPAAAKQDDPFGGDPFASGGSDDPFGGSGSQFSGFDSFDGDEDEAASDSPGMRRNRTVDMASALKTSDEVRAILVTASGDLMALDMRTGEVLQTFRAGNIQKILTVTNNLIYAQDLNNDLVALDVRTGVLVGRMTLSQDWHGVVNTISDRVYLQNDNGQVICMRPRSAVAPRYAIPSHLVKREIRTRTEEAVQAAENKSGDDVFGFGGEDPFGSSSGGSDPFGGDDPFK